jgi:outer membrane protein assembly factor BamE (lipoprotein component of BamABCDE complex)
MIRALLISASVVALLGCAPITTHHGSVKQQISAEQLREGMQQEEVLRVAGGPSARSSFGDEVWYYIQARKEQTAFLRPKVADQRVLAIHFDAMRRVASFEEYDLNDRESIALVQQQTPTEGHNIGFLEQALGNIGRFNAPRDRMGSAASGRGMP